MIDIQIVMPPDDWDRLRAQERTLVSTLHGACLAQPFANPFTWFAADITIDGQTRTQAAVRKKGFFGSLDTTKPALKVDLDEFRDNAGIYGVKKLTLNNAKQDPSLIRQCVGYQLFANAGLPAPRCNFARVRLNDKDLGIYVNVEEIRKPMLARYFSNDKGNLYEGTVSDFHPVLINTFEAQTNESANDRSDLARVVDALAADDGAIYASLGQVIDLDRFRTYWAMEGLIGFWDGYSSNRNNFYLYNDPSSGKFHFLPWGIDGILGDGTPIAAFQPNPNTALFAYSTIARRLVEQPGERAQYAARINSLLASIWNESALNAEIDRMQALLTPYVGDMTAALLPVRSFVNERRGRVAEALTSPSSFPPFSVLDYCLAEVGAVAGAFAATWGSYGGPDVADSSAALRVDVPGLPAIAALGVATTGLSTSDPNRYRGFLSVDVRSENRRAQFDAIVDSTRLVPGAHLPIDGQTVKASLSLAEGLLLLDQGSLRLKHASTSPNGRVCADFDAKAYIFTGRYLVGGPAQPPFPFAPSSEVRLTSENGGVMRACRPGRSE
ncbi:MAG TPA: CotH kinase family protein [Casimicrobiaceae bacterium]|nr:CotH kinase family protein [Casimicrobiaceae bacterium]